MAGMTDPKIIDSDGRWNADNEDEHLWWPRVLWIDPGTVSGVSCIWFDPQSLIDGKPLRRSLLAWHETYLYGAEDGVNGQINRFLRLRHMVAGEPGLATGVERFTLLRIDRSEDFLSPVRIRSGISFAMSVSKKMPGTFLEQSPGDAMTTFTDARLRELGLFTPGPDHIRDATRHCLLHIRKVGSHGKEAIERIHGEEPGWWR